MALQHLFWTCLEGRVKAEQVNGPFTLKIFCLDNVISKNKYITVLRHSNSEILHITMIKFKWS